MVLYRSGGEGVRCRVVLYSRGVRESEVSCGGVQ